MKKILISFAIITLLFSSNVYANLSENDKNFKTEIEKRLDTKYQKMVQKVLVKFEKKIEKYSPAQKQKITHRLVDRVDLVISDFLMNYPQDIALPEKANNIYLTLELLRFKLMSMDFWEVSQENNETVKKFGIFTVSDDGLSAEVEGGITDKTLVNFKKMIKMYPILNKLNLVDVPGSDVSGDKETDTALDLGREIYKNNISTHLVDGGFVASGGTDLLASGKKVSVGKNVEIGVHAWSGGLDDNPDGTAWEIKDDKDHIEHQKYLRYFEDIGFSKQKASDFYFFTISSSKAEDVHNMTKEEIEKYLIR